MIQSILYPRRYSAAIATTATDANDRPLADQRIRSITVDTKGAQLADVVKYPDRQR